MHKLVTLTIVYYLGTRANANIFAMNEQYIDKWYLYVHLVFRIVILLPSNLSTCFLKPFEFSINFNANCSALKHAHNARYFFKRNQLFRGLHSKSITIFYSLLRRWHTLKHDFLIRSTNALCNDRSIIVSEKSISPLWVILTQSYFTFCFDVSEKRKWHTIKLGRWNERDSKSKHRSVFRKRILRKDV